MKFFSSASDGIGLAELDASFTISFPYISQMGREKIWRNRAWKKTALVTCPLLLSGFFSLGSRIGINKTRSLNLDLQSTENSLQISFQKPKPRAVNHSCLQLDHWITTCLKTLNWKAHKPKLMYLYLVFNFYYLKIDITWGWFGDRILNREWKLFLIINI